MVTWTTYIQVILAELVLLSLFVDSISAFTVAQGITIALDKGALHNASFHVHSVNFMQISVDFSWRKNSTSYSLAKKGTY